MSKAAFFVYIDFGKQIARRALIEKFRLNPREKHQLINNISIEFLCVYSIIIENHTDLSSLAVQIGVISTHTEANQIGALK